VSFSPLSVLTFIILAADKYMYEKISERSEGDSFSMDLFVVHMVFGQC